MVTYKNYNQPLKCKSCQKILYPKSKYMDRTKLILYGIIYATCCIKRDERATGISWMSPALYFVNFWKNLLNVKYRSSGFSVGHVQSLKNQESFISYYYDVS